MSAPCPLDFGQNLFRVILASYKTKKVSLHRRATVPCVDSCHHRLTTTTSDIFHISESAR
jgi:hypothetical protein